MKNVMKNVLLIIGLVAGSQLNAMTETVDSKASDAGLTSVVAGSPGSPYTKSTKARDAKALLSIFGNVFDAEQSFITECDAYQEVDHAYRTHRALLDIADILANPSVLKSTITTVIDKYAEDPTKKSLVAHLRFARTLLTSSDQKELETLPHDSESEDFASIYLMRRLAEEATSGHLENVKLLSKLPTVQGFDDAFFTETLKQVRIKSRQSGLENSHTDIITLLGILKKQALARHEADWLSNKKNTDNAEALGQQRGKGKVTVKKLAQKKTIVVVMIFVVIPVVAHATVFLVGKLCGMLLKSVAVKNWRRRTPLLARKARSIGANGVGWIGTNGRAECQTRIPV